MIPMLRRAAIFAALFLVFGAQGLWAQDVTLTSRDGLITLHGTMEGYDGEFYRVMTGYGLLTLDGQGVVCAGPGCPDLTAFVAEVTIAAPQGAARLLPALIEAFAVQQGYALDRVLLAGNGVRFLLGDAATGLQIARLTLRLDETDQGLADLQAGRIDLALSLRSLPGLPGQAQVLALDAGVPVVSPYNPLRQISLPMLAAALSGQVTNWADLGGPDAPIILHAMAAGSGMQQALEARLQVVTSAAALRHETPGDLVDAVARDPWALGIAAASDLGNVRALDLSGACGVLMRATPGAIKAEDYPLGLPLTLYVAGRRQAPVIRDLLDWLSSPQAQLTVGAAGLTDQLPARTGVAAQGARLADAIAAAGPEVDLAALQAMVAVMAGAERLSTTFRFDGGARGLNAQSQGNVLALARALEAGMHDGQELVFAGFSDGRGAAAANLRLSRARAEAVRDAVLAAAPLLDADQVALLVEAFGEALPMACDDTDLGSEVNRRVEVWLRPAAVGVAKDSPKTGN